jgi:hypothetical protein
VTNGRVEDAVLDYINTANMGWERRKFPNPLRTIEKSALVRQFTDLHGAFLPKETRDFQALLGLILRDDRAPLDKPAFAHFLESTLRIEEDLKRLEAARSFVSCLLLTSYVLGSSVETGNFWAQFEAWTMVCSYIACRVTRDSLDESDWKPSFDLALLSARRALGGLVQECRERTEYIEGHPLADGYFYGARQTLLTGLVAAWGLNERRKGQPANFAGEFLAKSIRHCFYWGESAIPNLFLASLELGQRCQPVTAEGLMLQTLDIAGMANEYGRCGVPDTFVSIEDALDSFPSIVLPLVFPSGQISVPDPRRDEHEALILPCPIRCRQLFGSFLVILSRLRFVVLAGTKLPYGATRRNIECSVEYIGYSIKPMGLRGIPGGKSIPFNSRSGGTYQTCDQSRQVRPPG